MKIPFWNALEKGERFLMVGAGGGFDFVHGIPLYLYITRVLKKEVVLANYSFCSFSDLEKSQSQRVFYGTYKVTKDAINLDYFPEKYTSEWFWENDQVNIPIYTFYYGLGVQPLRRAYNYLIEEYQVDSLVLVDGGTDSIIFGDERGLGTIVEDANSMVAAAKTDVPNKYLVSIGFGVDHFHGVNHYNFLENVSTLIKEDGYLGTFSLTQDMPEGKRYLALIHYLNEKNNRQSIVANSIAGALEGDFGNIHRTSLTQDSELFINPLMSLYWTFSLEQVISRMIFASELEDCETIRDVVNQIRIHKLDRNNQYRYSQSIPL
ncbi:DUF1152 domain-containing protein [Neisseria sp. Ec49-e6-T10]|uniref:DUF1152 domain-containing protein n=1 Tax=Neisseria sp. Ec49-e6-T10 TaxID=3140744 RepID=UPI003EB8A845